MLQQLHINASQHTIIYCQVLLMSHTFSVKKPAVLSLLAAVRFSAGVPSYIFRFCLKLLPFFKHSHIFAVKKTYLRNIHCPADMSESKADTHLPLHYIFMNAIVSQFTFKSISAAASCGPAPRPQINTLFLNGVACSVCTVDLASCSNVMQCKENFYSLTGLPSDFSARIHHEHYVSQA